MDGVDLREINIRHLRNHIALVNQEPTLFNQTIAQNICYGMDEVDQAKLVEAAKLANIHDFVLTLPQVGPSYFLSTKSSRATKQWSALEAPNFPVANDKESQSPGRLFEALEFYCSTRPRVRWTVIRRSWFKKRLITLQRDGHAL